MFNVTMIIVIKLEVILMIDYKTLYHYLFCGITDIINEMENPFTEISKNETINYLKLLQFNAEELYLEQEDDSEETG